MPEKGFTAITVKEEHSERIRSCYKALVEGSGLPVILDNEAYKVIEEIIAGRKARTADQAANSIIRAQGGRGGFYLSIPDELLFLCQKFLSMQKERSGIDTLEDLLLNALHDFLYPRLTDSPESIWQIGERLYLVGDLYVPDSIETWIFLVKRKLREGARVRIIEWRRAEPSEEGFLAYLGAEIDKTWFIVGGMNNFSRSGRAAYQTARDFLKQIRHKPEVRDGKDSLFKDFIEKSDHLTFPRIWHLKTIADFSKSTS